jgi:uncharacterized membrane protein YbhN (UPF0104 family)
VTNGGRGLSALQGWPTWLLKLALALVALVWVAWRGKFNALAHCFATASPGWFVLAVVTYLAGQSLCAWKWGLLSRGLGFRKSPRFYWMHYLGAGFVSLFLPTGIGGDVFRALALAQETGHRGRATVSVLADRGTGVLSLVWIAAAAAALLPQAPTLPPVLHQGLYAVGAVATAGFALPFFLRGRIRTGKRLGLLLMCWDDPRGLLQALGLAFVFQLLLGTIYLLLGMALSLPLDAGLYYAVGPLASLAAMIPFSLNGIGERAAATVFLFTLAGVPEERAVAFAMAWVALSTLSAMFGGLILLVGRGAAPVEAAAAT